MKIRISLPENRDRAGWLEVVGEGGLVVFGPVPAAGRAHDEVARAHGNAERNPLRPYGDTPLGGYVVSGVTESVVLLEPASGPAALADAHGRFRFLIQGGAGDERLHATAGAVRLFDRDQKRLVALMRRAGPRAPCEIVTTPAEGEAVDLTRIPADLDPPAAPGRSTFAPARPAASLHARGQPAAAGQPTRPAKRFFVAPERSGAGGATAYGGGGPTPGSDSGDDGPGVGPLPASGVDVAPTPGSDLTPAQDQTVTLAQTGADSMLSTSPPATVSNPNDQPVGWLEAPPPGNPYTPAITNTSDPLAPYAGTNTGVYATTPPGADANASLGGPADIPYVAIYRTIDTSGYQAFNGPGGVAAPSTAAADQAAAEAAFGPQNGVASGGVQVVDATTLQGLTSSGTATDPYGNTSAVFQLANGNVAYLNDMKYPGQALIVQASQGDPTADGGYSNIFLPAAGALNAASSAANRPGYQPPRVAAAPPPVQAPAPPRVQSTGAWSRGGPSQAAQTAIEEQIELGFMNPLPPGMEVADLDMATATAQTSASINRGILGQTAEITAYDYRLSQGEVGILAPKGVNVSGLDYATATQLPNGDYIINVGDTASRYTSNPFKTSPGAPKATWLNELDAAFGPGGSFSLPNNPTVEQGIRDAYAANRISNVQIDTVDFSAAGRGELTVGGVAVRIDPLAPSPGASTAEGAGLGESLSGGLGGGLSPGMGAALGGLNVLGGALTIASATDPDLPGPLVPVAVVSGSLQFTGGLAAGVGALGGDAAMVTAGLGVAETGGVLGIPLTIYGLWKGIEAATNGLIQGMINGQIQQDQDAARAGSSTGELPPPYLNNGPTGDPFNDFFQ